MGKKEKARQPSAISQGRAEGRERLARVLPQSGFRPGIENFGTTPTAQPQAPDPVRRMCCEVTDGTWD